MMPARCYYYAAADAAIAAAAMPYAVVSLFRAICQRAMLIYIPIPLISRHYYFLFPFVTLCRYAAAAFCRAFRVAAGATRRCRHADMPDTYTLRTRH